MGLRDEIREQPEATRRLLRDGAASIAVAAAAIRRRNPRLVVIAARGTSDHAAIYAQYLLETMHRLPVALAAPSTLSLYGVAPRLDDALVVGISQSGASPDIVGYVAEARRQGALTVALTNDAASPLAAAAELTIDLLAGPELAVAATKTYTAELLAIAMLSAALADDRAALAELEAVPAAIQAVLEAEESAVAAAGSLLGHGRCVVLGRGYEYATVREWALKLKELCQIFADPYSTADFQHGPLALAEPGLPILAIAPPGPGTDQLLELLARLHEEVRASLIVVAEPGRAPAAASVLPIPPGLPARVAPIVTIVPGQLVAFHLARLSGHDPEAPRFLQKVTLTL